MGSEKKKKDKKKEKKKKHRHERSESHERKERKRQKVDSPHDSSDNVEKSSLSVSETNKLREKIGLKPLDVEPESTKTEENVTSLSIEESNKLRAELGLRPLDVANKSSDVHVPAKNIGKIQQSEKLAEKMKMLQEKRRIKQHLSSVKSLGSASVDLTDTMAWVQRSRGIASKKAAAAAQTKLLDAMDDEFGVGELVEQEKFKKEYTSKDMKNLTVLHDVDSFKEGNMTILTLQDKDILDENGDENNDEDVLVNVNMLDNEKSDKCNELKKMKPDYNPYTDDVDEHGNIKRQNMLSKYDEVIEGEKKKSFKLSEAENIEVIHQKMAAGLPKKPGNITLDTSHLQKISSEYYTADEVALFKKPRKKKLRKIRKTKVDEIISLPNENKLSGSKDHGSRADRSEDSDINPKKEVNNDSDNMEIDIG